MILIGQYDSPFVRRVGIAMTLYGMAFEHRPWSTFADADLLRPYNPLTRVPTLVLDDGTALVESHLILAYLDGLVGPGKALLPADPAARPKALRIIGLGTGLAEKAVSLFYEGRMHGEVSEVWAGRCRAQIAAVTEVLEDDRAMVATPWWLGDGPGHADIAVACALRFLADVHPGLVDLARFPALAAHAAALEATPAFRTISQPFVPPPA